MTENRIGPALSYGVNGFRQVDQPFDGPHRNTMIQGNNNGVARVAIHDPLHPN